MNRRWDVTPVTADPPILLYNNHLKDATASPRPIKENIMLTMLWIVDDFGQLRMTWVKTPATCIDLLSVRETASLEQRCPSAAPSFSSGSPVRERFLDLPEAARA